MSFQLIDVLEQVLIFLFQNNNLSFLILLTFFSNNIESEFLLVDVFEQVLMLFLFKNNNVPLLLLLTFFHSYDIVCEFLSD